jgi:hypothetical protein
MSKPTAGKVTPITLRRATAEDYRKANYQVGTFHRVAVKCPPTANEGVAKPGNTSPK